MSYDFLFFQHFPKWLADEVLLQILILDGIVLR